MAGADMGADNERGSGEVGGDKMDDAADVEMGVEVTCDVEVEIDVELTMDDWVDEREVRGDEVLLECVEVEVDVDVADEVTIAAEEVGKMKAGETLAVSGSGGAADVRDTNVGDDDGDGFGDDFIVSTAAPTVDGDVNDDDTAEVEEVEEEEEDAEEEDADDEDGLSWRMTEDSSSESAVGGVLSNHLTSFLCVLSSAGGVVGPAVAIVVVVVVVVVVPSFPLPVVIKGEPARRNMDGGRVKEPRQPGGDEGVGD